MPQISLRCTDHETERGTPARISIYDQGLPGP